MDEPTPTPSEVRTALEATDKRLRIIYRYVKDASGDEELEKQLKRAKKQLRTNRNLLQAGSDPDAKAPEKAPAASRAKRGRSGKETAAEVG